MLKFVMVVDDDFEHRDTTVEMLLDHGFPTMSVENGYEALIIAKVHGEHLLAFVLAVEVAALDGGEFRARQLSDPAIASIPLIVVCGDGPSRSAPLLLNVLDALRKPVHHDPLVLVLRGVA